MVWRAAASLAVLVFAAGFCVSGAQTGLYAFAPGCYPTIARATGVSWIRVWAASAASAGRLLAAHCLGLAKASAQSSEFLHPCDVRRTSYCVYSVAREVDREGVAH